MYFVALVLIIHGIFQFENANELMRLLDYLFIINIFVVQIKGYESLVLSHVPTGDLRPCVPHRQPICDIKDTSLVSQMSIGSVITFIIE